MSNPIEAFNRKWERLDRFNTLRTPDNERGKLFEITNLTDEAVTITTEGSSEVTITRNAFIATLNYLITHGHDHNTPCIIESNNDINEAGPLCRIARQHNNGTRCINYIVPILTRIGILNFDGRRRNTTWLAWPPTR